jgi:hypothetical protein
VEQIITETGGALASIPVEANLKAGNIGTTLNPKSQAMHSRTVFGAVALGKSA